MIKYGSYRAFQRYLCEDCDHTFNNKIRTIFAHAKIALNEWLFTIYAFVRFNTSIRQFTAELDLSYKTLHRRVERFTKALDAPSIKLRGPVEIDKLSVSAGLKGRECDGPSRSHGLSTCGRETYEGDKPPGSFSLIEGWGSGTSSRQNQRMNQQSGSFSRAARRSH